MAILRTTLQTIVGIVILLGALLLLFSPSGPLADPAELAPAGRPTHNRIRIMQMDWSRDATAGLSLSRGDVDGGNLVLWHRSDEERRSQIVQTGESQIWKTALAPEGEVAFVFGSSEGVSRIDLRSRERTRLFQVPPGSALTRLSVSPDGAVLAMAIEKEIVLCDSRTGVVIKQLPPSFGDINSVAFSADGHLLAIGSDDGAVQVWNNETSSLVRHFSNHEGPVSGVEFTADGRQLFSIGLLDDTLQLCDLESAETRVQIATGHAGTQAMAVSPDGRLAATGGNDRLILLWDLRNRAQIARFEGHSGVIIALRFSADGRALLSAGDSTIHSWNVDSPSTPVEIEAILPSATRRDE